MNFEACLALPHDPREAELIADNLESLARALREWSDEAWKAVSGSETKTPSAAGLFDRLLTGTAPAALDPRHRAEALASAEAAASVLRVLWPEATNRTGTARPPLEELLATS